MSSPDLQWDEPIPVVAPQQHGVKLLGELLEKLASIPDSVYGSAEVQCVRCHASYTRHYGQRSKRYFFRHPGAPVIIYSQACALSGRTFWGQDEQQARNAINT